MVVGKIVYSPNYGQEETSLTLKEFLEKPKKPGKVLKKAYKQYKLLTPQS